ncbi:NirD/YgiW/YdeI family stress tolerance protein [Kiloniella litopenaei]|uniref:NirD/YgiW/YdeI family stress tolerance protein n=1 Tax=Kiloniella litopenaei TaxID=1549748 RepID=UPI003BA9E6F4
MLRKLMMTTAITATSALAFSAVAQAEKKDPYSDTYQDDSAISITGTVMKAYPDAFELRYGEQGSITIEMDDWDWYDESRAIKVGEKVTVYGDIDQDLYESRKIEADSVYAHSRNTYYFANDADEEDYYTTYYFTPKTSDLDDIPDDALVNIRGTVQEIDGREFVLGVGKNSITVDTDDMSINPLDEKGYQRIKKGDTVYVSGEMDKDFFEENEIEAHHVVTLYKAKKKS